MLRKYFPDEPLAIPALFAAGLLLIGFLFMPPGLVSYMNEHPFAFAITALGATAFVFGAAQLVVSEVQFRGIRRFLLRSCFRILTILAITLVIAGSTYSVIGILEAIAPQQMEAARTSGSLTLQLIVTALICLPMLATAWFFAFKTPRWGQHLSDWFWNTHRELNLTEFDIERRDARTERLQSLVAKLPSYLELRIPSDLDVKLDRNTLENLTYWLHDPDNVALSSSRLVQLDAFVMLSKDEVDQPNESSRWYLTLFKLAELEKALYAAKQAELNGSKYFDGDWLGLDLFTELHRDVLSAPTRDKRNQAFVRLVDFQNHLDARALVKGMRSNGLGYLAEAVSLYIETVESIYDDLLEDVERLKEKIEKVIEAHRNDEIPQAEVLDTVHSLITRYDFKVRLDAIDSIKQTLCGSNAAERQAGYRKLLEIMKNDEQ